MAFPPRSLAPSTALLLSLPLAYFCRSRVPLGRQKVGWALGYVLPVLALGAVAHGGAAGLLPAALMMLAVYTAYEFGYLVNDTLTIEREPRPTLRLSPSERTALRQGLGVALLARLTIGLALIALLFVWQGPAIAAAALGWAALWPLFGMYNFWRGRLTIALHFVLVGLRYLLPIFAAAPSLDPAAAAPLLLLHALPTSFEAAWKPRYGWRALQRLAGGVHRFRVVWSGTLAAAAWVLAWAMPTSMAWWFAVAASYYFLFRAGAWLWHEGQRSTAATLGPTPPST